MAGTLRHRGPDDLRVWRKGDVGLGYTRLAIINPGGSRQPAHGAGVHLCFNGEILNYAELRQEFGVTAPGDTPVLHAALSAKGIDCLSDLRGQFAFGAYFEREDALVLARDRLGILPLFYAMQDDEVCFASEVKALISGIRHRPRVDPEFVTEYLASRAVRAPNHILQGIHKVPAGSALVFPRAGGPLEHNYWRPPAKGVHGPRSTDELVDELDRLVDSAIDTNLVSDVAVGSYLSGGLDSSLVSARTVDKVGFGQLHTFAAGFQNADADELPAARAVARHLGTRHHEVIVRRADFFSDWSRLSWFRDGPLSEPSDVAVAALARRASDYVKVVLSGEGADELFAGYPKHRADRWVARIAALPAPPRRRAVEWIGSRLPRHRRLGVLLQASGASSESERNATWFSPFTFSQIDRLTQGASTGFKARQLASYTEITQGLNGSLDRMLAYDLATWLPDNLLERGDRMTMASSVELRPPYLDHPLVEFATALPSGVLLGKEPKWLLRKVAERSLPQWVTRRRKMGFPVPISEWFREESALLNQLILGADSYTSEHFSRQYVKEILDRHTHGVADESSKLWALASLEMWYRGYRSGAEGGLSE